MDVGVHLLGCMLPHIRERLAGCPSDTERIAATGKLVIVLRDVAPVQRLSMQFPPTHGLDARAPADGTKWEVDALLLLEEAVPQTAHRVPEA